MGRKNAGQVKIHGRQARLLLRDRIRASVKALPKPPASYLPSAQYQVNLSQRYVIPGTNHVLRPGEKVVISGKFAAQIASLIVGAQQVS